MTWPGKYRKLLTRLAAIYGSWLGLVFITALLPVPSVSDQAYAILGKSVLYFTPAVLFPLILTMKKWWTVRQMGQGKNEAFVTFLEQEQEKLGSALQFMQLIFLLMLSAALAVTLIYRSAAAIWLMGVTIQWMILTVIHFSEHYYAGNLLREMNTDKGN